MKVWWDILRYWILHHTHLAHTHTSWNAMQSPRKVLDSIRMKRKLKSHDQIYTIYNIQSHCFHSIWCYSICYLRQTIRGKTSKWKPNGLHLRHKLFSVSFVRLWLPLPLPRSLLTECIYCNRYSWLFIHRFEKTFLMRVDTHTHALAPI